MKKHNILFLILVLFITSQTNVFAENYAILYSGGHTNSDDNFGTSEFWYDIFDAYKDLILNENYSHENIFFFYGDGNDFTTSKYSEYRPSTYGWSSIVDFDNSESTLNTQLANIASTITNNDNLLIRWTSHGGPGSNTDDYYTSISDASGSIIDNIEDVDLFAMINQINNYKRRKIIWETCHSGCIALGSQNLNNSRTTIITASNYNESSWAYMSAPHNHCHMEFNWVITSSLQSEDPSGNPYNGDHNSDNVISMNDLYTEANTSSIMNSTPQLGDNGSLVNKIFVNENLILENSTFSIDHQYWTETITIRNLTINNNSDVIFEIDENIDIQRDFNVQLGSTFNVINR